MTKKHNKMNTSESSDLAEKEKRKGGEKVRRNYIVFKDSKQVQVYKDLVLQFREF